MKHSHLITDVSFLNEWKGLRSAFMIMALAGVTLSVQSQMSTGARASEQDGQSTLSEQIMALPVWDTHNHLAGPYFKAQDFYEIAHYFWFIRELYAVGYPEKPENVRKGVAGPDYLSEQERAEAFLKALELSANTTWNHMFRQGIKDLFDVDLETPEDIFEINEILKQTREDPDWSARVLDKIGVKRLSIQWRARNSDNGLHEIEDRHHYYAIFNPAGGGDIRTIREAANSREAAEKVLAEKKAKLDDYLANGVRVFRFRLDVEATEQGNLMSKPDLSWDEEDSWNIKQYLTHSVLEYMNGKDVHLQLFFEVGRMLPVNQTDQVLGWDPLFEKYDGITFELFAASHIHSLDMVQVARNNPNVYPGGMWWLTYRRSQFLENMQHRIEALPACRSTFVASDARRVEWVYIKLLMQKRVLAEFMEKQVADGWLTEEEAVEAARWWLYDSVVALYEGTPCGQARTLPGGE